MQSRLVPVGFVFNRFPRMVRDLAKQQKKEVSLEMLGSDIELDRAVIDEIGESLVHLLRNAVDHGIEPPEARKRAGKPAQGTIRVTAKRTKGFVIIEVADNGQGLDLEDIKSTAVKDKILSPQATTEELIQSIFFGVSTTKKVTAVSGRGFGLNIVKNKVESLGGAIRVESESKKGTTFVIEIPLTLAIIKALFVEVGSKAYAIPLASIERLVTVNKDDIKGMLNYEAIILNEEDIPVTRLDVLFDIPSLGLEGQPIVIVRKGEERLGLAVDAFLTTQEIVIKPLNKLVRENKYFSGSTIIGSGEVVLILDVANLMLTKRTHSVERVADKR
jgi:two-component system chemotaxis sensor kinase CheA